jgi:hypothetical protein
VKGMGWLENGYVGIIENGFSRGTESFFYF